MRISDGSASGGPSGSYFCHSTKVAKNEGVADPFPIA